MAMARSSARLRTACSPVFVDQRARSGDLLDSGEGTGIDPDGLFRKLFAQAHFGALGGATVCGNLQITRHEMAARFGTLL